jgi:hypothetical protein
MRARTCLSWVTVTLLAGVTAIPYQQAQAASPGSSVRSAPSSPSFTALNTPPSAAGAFGVLPSTRVLDTRIGLGAAKTPLAAGATLTVKVTGVGGVPAAGVSAVVVNVVAVSATKPGHLTGWASGTPRPRTSTLNFGLGRAIANEVLIPVGTDGKIALYNGAPGTVHVVADLAGYYRSGAPTVGGTLGVLPPTRVLDTRIGLGAAKTPLAAGATLTVKVTGVGGVPAAGVSAVIVNIIALSATKPGHLTGWASGTTRPRTSILNFVVGQAFANEVLIPVGTDGKIALYNGAPGTVQIVADLAGYYRSGAPTVGGALGVLSSTRVLDTRTGLGAAKAPLPAGATRTVKVTGVGGVPPAGVSAVVVNVVAVSATKGGYLTGWASGTTRPRTSIINFSTGQAIANEVVLPVGTDGKIALYNGSPGTVHVVADLAGYYRGASLPWSGPQQVVHRQSGEVSVSCAAATFCMAVDLYGNAFSWNGSAWSAPRIIIPGGDYFIDCPTTTFCLAAATTTGDVWVYRSGSWTHQPPVDVGAWVESLSCASETFCVLNRSGTTQVFNGSSWTTHYGVLPYERIQVSCPTNTFCMAVGEDLQRGNHGFAAHSADGATWTSYGQIGSGEASLVSVSCVSTQFCMASLSNGQITTFNGTGWSDPILEPGGPTGAAQIICLSTAFCLALGHPSTYVYHGNSWSGPTTSPPSSWGKASCGSPTFCTVFAGDGDNYRFDGATWSGPTPVLPYQGVLHSLSCPSVSFCMTADGSNTYTYNGSAWSAPLHIANQGGPELVSCTSASFCLAVVLGGGNGSWTWDGAHWTAHADPTDAPFFSALSCVSPTFCLGVTVDNFAYTFNGTGWSRPRQVGSTSLLGVSCATATFCMAVTDEGDVFILKGTTWSEGPSFTDFFIFAVSCPSTSFCMVADGEGISHTYNGTAWSSQTMPTRGAYAVSCSSSTFCAAFDERNVMTFDGTSWGPSTTLEATVTRGSISCPAARTCVLVDQAGRAFHTPVP